MVEEKTLEQEEDKILQSIISDDEIPVKKKAKEDKKLNRKKFDFLYKRTCFRLMCDFFKQTFNKVNKGKKVARNYNKCMQEFS